MKIGELVTYKGRRYYLRGFDPRGVSPRRAYLEDAETGERLKAPLSELEAEQKDESPEA